MCQRHQYLHKLAYIPYIQQFIFTLLLTFASNRIIAHSISRRVIFNLTYIFQFLKHLTSYTAIAFLLSTWHLLWQQPLLWQYNSCICSVTSAQSFTSQKSLPVALVLPMLHRSRYPVMKARHVGTRNSVRLINDNVSLRCRRIHV